jgi:hypothetical protein
VSGTLDSKETLFIIYMLYIFKKFDEKDLTVLGNNVKNRASNFTNFKKGIGCVACDNHDVSASFILKSN